MGSKPPALDKMVASEGNYKLVILFVVLQLWIMQPSSLVGAL